MIPFNKPVFLGNELEYMKQSIDSGKLCGDGEFTKRCQTWMEDNLGANKALLTTSGTAALEMSAFLAGIEPGDEVIMPSYTFVSTANAFVLRGAKVVFVDIRPDTMNIDEKIIEEAITDKTKAIVVVHYAGVACEMDTIMKIAAKHNLTLIEDAAQAMCAYYKGKPLGSLSDYGCISFHETKNYTMGEGGAVFLNNPKDLRRAEIVWEKGTNRKQFYRGEIDKYSWVDVGSSYLPSDMNAAYLWAQLEQSQEIKKNRVNSFCLYKEMLQGLDGIIDLPVVPDDCDHNGHMFYIKTKNLEERALFISYMKEKGISVVFHYVPLHTSIAGQKYGRFFGEDIYTTKESERLVRLPMYYGLEQTTIEYIVDNIKKFYKVK